MDGLDKLKAKMQERKPILLLGAGFSIGAKNYKGIKLPKGDELSDRLFKRMYPDSYDADYIKKAEKQKKSLKDLCSIFRSEDRVLRRNNEIVDIFKGSVPGENRFHDKFTRYPWNYIFTLNVDDLVENIYQMQGLQLNVWSTGQRGQRTYEKAPILIKLHGCVRAIDNGVVFDDEEYRSFTVRQNFLLKEFANQFVKNDVVIIGTEFQENDLQTVIELYREAGYNNSGYDYFFISPTINNLMLENTIKKYDNFHWIEMEAEKFLNYVEQEISKPEERRSVLKEHGACFIDDFNDKSKSYSSYIYSGNSSCYQDFFNNWDIQYSESQNQAQKIIASKEHYIISIAGKQYVGKTCVAKRFLVDFKLAGFEAFELIRLDYPIVREVRDYLKNKQPNSRVAILIDDSAFQYKNVVNLVSEVPDNIIQLVVITSDTMDNHNSRKYLLREYSNILNIVVRENVNKYRANRIYYKLLSKNRLGKYLKLLPPRQNPGCNKSQEIITNKMIGINDLIDVLYYTSEGRSFREYYSEWLNNNYEETSAMYLEALCFFGKLGVNWVPTQIIPSLIPSQQAKFSINKFQKQYNDIVEIKSGRLTIKRRRMIQSGMTFKTQFVIDAIFNTLLEISGLFSEYERNEYYEIFQKILRVKKLKKLGVSTKDVYNMLQDLEYNYKEFSYFWIQYGIAAQILEDYENATNHLNYAKHLQPDAFSVKHALAKNKMEIGLYKLRNNQIGADIDFSEGKADMLDLIESRKHMDNYLYSVHTYVALMLAYSNVSKTPLSKTDYEKIREHLKRITAGSIDSHMKDVIDSYVRHCKNYGMNSYCDGLERLPKEKVDRVATEDEYETDLIDS